MGVPGRTTSHQLSKALGLAASLLVAGEAAVAEWKPHTQSRHPKLRESCVACLSCGTFPRGAPNEFAGGCCPPTHIRTAGISRRGFLDLNLCSRSASSELAMFIATSPPTRDLISQSDPNTMSWSLFTYCHPIVAGIHMCGPLVHALELTNSCAACHFGLNPARRCTVD